MIDLKELLKLAKAATKGKWEYKGAKWGALGEPPLTWPRAVALLPAVPGVLEEREYQLTGNVDIVDAQFIAAANPEVVQELLEMISNLTQERNYWRTNGLASQRQLHSVREAIRNWDVADLRRMREESGNSNVQGLIDSIYRALSRGKGMDQ